MDESCQAASPNTKRRHRKAVIALKVESRKTLISAPNSSRLDMGRVHSALSGPRLSWDHANRAVDEECDGLIVDFHQDSRSALRTQISQAMSQMATRDMGSCGEDVEQLIAKKKKMRLESEGVRVTQAAASDSKARIYYDDDPPPLDEIRLWQETQGPVIELAEADMKPDDETVAADEILMDQAAQSTQPQVFVRPEDLIEPTQVYIRSEEVSEEKILRDSKFGKLLKKNSTLSSKPSLPPNTVEGSDEAPDDDSESEGSDSSADASEGANSEAPLSPPSSSVFAKWLAEQNRKKKQRKRKLESREASAFFEAEAEESEDEELGGIMRKRHLDDEDDDGSGSSEEDSDLEDLVASMEDEFAVQQRSKKDSKRLAKWHAKWVSERDEQLEKAVGDGGFWRRGNLAGHRLGGLPEGVEAGLSRLQRKRLARKEAVGEQYDAEGNLLAPEFDEAAEESDYDSMEIDSDEFCDEESENDQDDNRQVDEAQLALRKERKIRDAERRKRDLEIKQEMLRRRQLLKEKLRQERLMKQKDNREIQAGLGIMTEEDREAFKLVNRTQNGVFGYSGVTTQSTTPSTAATQASLTFSFLSLDISKETKISKPARSRRSSLGSLELE